MKRVYFILMVLFFSQLNVAQGLYQNSESIVIHKDGSVTPSSAPVIRTGEVYTLNGDIFIPTSTNEGIIIERSGVTLNGAGYKIQGHGQSSAIFLENLIGVTIKNVRFDNFYWGLEMWNCTKCTINNNELTGVMYPIYLKNSSSNKFYHNNIYRIPYYTNSDNFWDNGYPSGGNYWENYPYTDTKKGPNQDISGSDGIGDVKVGSEIFSQGGANVDNYPMMKAQIFQAEASTSLNVNVKDAQGNPIMGAEVVSTVQPAGQVSLNGVSGANGAKTFDIVKPGSYKIQVTKSGYAAALTTVIVVEGVSTEISVTLQSTQATGTLIVIVKDGKGSGLAGVLISSTVQPSGQSALAGSTGIDGIASFTGIWVGSYTIQASKDGYTQKTGQSNVISDTTTNLNLILEASSTGGTTGGSTASGGGIPGFTYQSTLSGLIISLIIILYKRNH